MKKLFVLLLALALLLCLAACGESASPAANTPGEGTMDSSASPQNDTSAGAADEAAVETETWYGQTGGMDLSLALGADGRYTLTLAGKPQTGVWAEREGAVYLDGEAAASLLLVGDRLYWEAAGLWLSKDQPEFAAVYVPAELLTEGVSAENFTGYWTAYCAEADGAVFPAEDLGEQTDVYIEAPRAALGGPLFGDVVVDLAFADGALRYEAAGVSVTMQLQEDGLLRMTLHSADADLTLYLAATYVEGLSPEIEEG